MIRIACLALVIVLAAANYAEAGGPCSGVKGGCGRSSYRSSSSSSYRSSAPSYSPPSYSSSSTKKDCTGSTSVEGHYRDGHWVSGHSRCTSGSGSSEPSYRSTARSAVRVKAWNGTSSTYDDTDDEVKPFELARPIKHAPTAVPPKYILHLKSGRDFPAVRVEEKGSDYFVEGVTGGRVPYPKSMVKSVEKLSGTEDDTPQAINAAATIKGQLVSSTDDLPQEGIVKRVIDGDTIELADGETIRLIGIDTPETVHPTKPVERFGREAKAFTAGMLEGEKVKLVYDPASAATNHRDKYGRLLAYIYRHDGVDFNAFIIKMGFAHAYTEFPFARSDEFLGYEALARERSLGLWASDGVEAPRPPPSAPSAPGKEGDTVRRTPRERDRAPVDPQPLMQQPDKEGGSYWLTTSSSKRHNSGCRYFRNSKGRECGPNEGIACKICGG